MTQSKYTEHELKPAEFHTSKNVSAFALLIFSALLIIAWPMSHSIAIRNVLLATLIIIEWQKLKLIKSGGVIPKALKNTAITYLLLSVWLLASTLLADSPMNALSQYRGEWLKIGRASCRERV